jgi:hypothetical protein
LVKKCNEGIIFPHFWAESGGYQDQHFLPRNVKINNMQRKGKQTFFPGFRARARSSRYLRIFWAEKLVLVIIHQILPKNVETIIPSLHFLTNQLTLSRFLADLVHFNGPELPVDQF